MAFGRRLSVSYARRFTAAGLTAAGAFVISAGAGLQSWAVAALGIALVVLAVSLLVISGVRGGARSFVRGTAHVLDATEPPANTPIGRCTLQIVVEAEGVPAATVKIRDTRVPVAKWPDIGDTLPIRVALEDPRHVRILWDEVRTHGEAAAEEERFHEYVQRIVDAELGGGEGGGDTLHGDTLHGDTLEDENPPMSSAGEPLEPPLVPRPRPRPRPSPRPRRPAAAGATAVVSAPADRGTTTKDFPGAPEAEPEAQPAAEPEAQPEAQPAAEPEAQPAAEPEAQPAAEPAAEPEAQPAAESEAQPVPAEDEEVPVHDVVPIEGASAVFGAPPGRSGGDAPAGEADAEALRDLLAAFPGSRAEPGAIHGVGVTLIVADLSRTIDFYRDKLGFYLVDSGESSAVLASGETRLLVRCVPDMARVDRRLVHLNLEVGDVEAVYEELRAKGVEFIHRPRPVARGEHMELWAAAFRDPDGHGIALIKWKELP